MLILASAEDGNLLILTYLGVAIYNNFALQSKEEKEKV